MHFGVCVFNSSPHNAVHVCLLEWLMLNSVFNVLFCIRVSLPVLMSACMSVIIKNLYVMCISWCISIYVHHYPLCYVKIDSTGIVLIAEVSASSHSKLNATLVYVACVSI